MVEYNILLLVECSDSVCACMHVHDNATCNVNITKRVEVYHVPMYMVYIYPTLSMLSCLNSIIYMYIVEHSFILIGSMWIWWIYTYPCMVLCVCSAMYNYIL